MLNGRLRQALVQLNPALPAEAIEDAFRRVTRPEGTTVETASLSNTGGRTAQSPARASTPSEMISASLKLNSDGIPAVC